MPELVGALDQGTTSTRFMVFDREGRVQARAQLEHAQGLPRPGWVEHDADEIWGNAVAVVGRALDEAGLVPADLVACGITNQRETTVVWDRRSGRPYGPAIVWQDTRTDAVVTAVAERDDGRGGELIRSRTGLLPATYFAGGKLAWILREHPEVRADAEAGHALFGTVDSWLVWHLTGRHVTDVTNASRTMLMDLHTLDWDDELLALFDIPRRMLPTVVASNGTDQFGAGAPDGPLPGVLITAVLGDQHAATVGQTCFAPGEAKNTYGTGNFLLLNTGPAPTASGRGLLTTVAYRFEGAAPVYALEGSIAVTGSAVQWLRDQLGLIDDAAGIESLARQVDDSSGVYFVPAFSGLFAPYWRPDARGAIVGLSRFDSAAHLARATLEAICFQTRDVVDAMAADSGVALDVLKVDGGVTANDLCMQIQADVLGVAVSRPSVTETTALGAAFAAGLAVGYWASTDDLRATWHEDGHWEPAWSEDRRESAYAGWHKAVARTLDWVDPPDDAAPAGGDRT